MQIEAESLLRVWTLELGPACGADQRRSSLNAHPRARQQPIEPSALQSAPRVPHGNERGPLTHDPPFAAEAVGGGGGGMPGGGMPGGG
eukprot:CAMPEP_0185186918 /NCGR_PEP_ID=MMETSP1140-20130426/4377_1 /TAXON_ID=298111 /ORGANISM="Pavlova sp., Strain CCMP459" /LENGTH=87 /DNA_ID=CAMNT_0027753247 /DNA_START=15 /DNA_END=275 /DNA_ORIENTATION=+